MRSFRYIFILLVLLVLPFAFSQDIVKSESSVSGVYDFCILENHYDDEKCSDILNMSYEVSQALDEIYSPTIDRDNFIQCTIDEIELGNLDYLSIRDKCYLKLMQQENLESTLSFFNVDCAYSINEGNLDIECKSLTPLTCFDTELDLIEHETNYLITPIILKNDKDCLNYTSINLTAETFNIDPEKQVMIDETSFLDSTGKRTNLSSFIDGVSLISEVETAGDVELAYLSCVVNYYLHGKIYPNKNVDYWGNTFTPEIVSNRCSDTISFGSDIDYLTIRDKQGRLKEDMKNIVDEFMMQKSNYNVYDFFDKILKKYSLYSDLEDEVNLKVVRNVRQNPNIHELIDKLEKLLEDKTENQKDEIVQGFKKTLLEDLKNRLEFRRKKSVTDVINFFDEDLSQYDGTQIENILVNVKHEIVLELVEDEEYLDLTDLDFSLSKESLSIENVTLSTKKEIKVLSDNYYSLLPSEDKIKFSINDSKYISTNLSISFKENSMYVDSRSISTLKSIEDSRLEEKTESIELLLDSNDTLVYKIEKDVSGYFLGLFKVNMNVIEYYNAEEGNLYDVEKPWWNMFIIFSKSASEGVVDGANTIAKSTEAI